MKIILQMILFAGVLFSCTSADRTKQHSSKANIIGTEPLISAESMEENFKEVIESIDIINQTTQDDSSTQKKELPSIMPAKVKSWESPANATQVFSKIAVELMKNSTSDSFYTQYRPYLDLFYEENSTVEQIHESYACLLEARSAMLWTAYYLSSKNNTYAQVYHNGFSIDADFRSLLSDSQEINSDDSRLSEEFISNLVEEIWRERCRAMGKLFFSEITTFEYFLKANNRSLNQEFQQMKTKFEGWSLQQIRTKAITKIEDTFRKVSAYKENYKAEISKRRNLAEKRSLILLRHHSILIAQELGELFVVKKLEGSKFERMLLAAIVAHLSRLGMNLDSMNIGERMEVFVEVFTNSVVKQANLIRENFVKSFFKDPIRLYIPVRKPFNSIHEMETFLKTGY